MLLFHFYRGYFFSAILKINVRNMSLWSLWFLITSTVIFIGFIESESPELPQERQVVAFFDRSSSFGKINRKGVFNFPFVCIQTPQKTVEKIRFELKTSEENLFVKTIKCAESTESKRHKLRVKLPAGYIFNYDYYQEWMIFEDSISAVLSGKRNNNCYFSKLSFLFITQTINLKPKKY